MIDKNELQIGNWVVVKVAPEGPVYYRQIIALEESTCRLANFPDMPIGKTRNSDREYADIDSITLTPTILENCSFHPVDSGIPPNRWYHNGVQGLCIDNEDETFVWHIFPTQRDIVHLDSVHQLQNLFFALTRQRLIVRLVENQAYRK